MLRIFTLALGLYGCATVECNMAYSEDGDEYDQCLIDKDAYNADRARQRMENRAEMRKDDATIAAERRIREQEEAKRAEAAEQARMEAEQARILGEAKRSQAICEKMGAGPGQERHWECMRYLEERKAREDRQRREEVEDERYADEQEEERQRREDAENAAMIKAVADGFANGMKASTPPPPPPPAKSVTCRTYDYGHMVETRCN